MCNDPEARFALKELIARITSDAPDPERIQVRFTYTGEVPALLDVIAGKQVAPSEPSLAGRLVGYGHWPPGGPMGYFVAGDSLYFLPQSEALSPELVHS